MGFQRDIRISHFLALLGQGNGQCLDQTGYDVFALIVNGKITPQPQRVLRPSRIVGEYHSSARIFRQIAVNHGLDGDRRSPIL